MPLMLIYAMKLISTFLAVATTFSCKLACGLKMNSNRSMPANALTKLFLSAKSPIRTLTPRASSLLAASFVRARPKRWASGQARFSKSAHTFRNKLSQYDYVVIPKYDHSFTRGIRRVYHQHIRTGFYRITRGRLIRIQYQQTLSYQ